MSTGHDLRNRAERLRQTIPQSAAPPEENGPRLATIPRDDNTEIRVNWSSYEGKPFVSLRLWTRNERGEWWPDRARGMSIRVKELPDLVDGIAAALDMAEQHFEDQESQSQSQSQRRLPMPGRALDRGR
jgi:hypothetical protein